MKTLTTILLNTVHQIYSINRIYLMALTALGIFNTSIAISQGGPTTFCSGTKTYVTALGTVSDGSGHYSYQSNSNCKFLIKPPGAISISLYVNDFDTEINSDFVSIYDGETTSAPLLGKYSGDKSSLPTAIYATGGSMLLLFTSDNSNVTSYTNPAGFEFDYEATIGPWCSGTQSITNPQGTITDGSTQGNYDNNTSCKWLIEPANATKIDLTFTKMDVENNYDLVKVYDGDNTNAPLLGTFTQNTSLATISSTDGKMLIHFTSDANVNMDGWSADYVSTTNNQACSGVTTLTNTSGVFNDGSGSSNYGFNSDCKWLIAPSNASDITLDFSWIETEANYDYIRVYDGNSTSSPLLATYTGNYFSTTAITSTGGEMLVHFSSDSYVNKDGFEGTWTSNQNNPVTYCSGTTNLTVASGTFDDGSGNTTKYQNNANCEWLIKPAGATSVTLDFSYIQLTGNDFVYVYDGANVNATLLGSFNGYNTSSLPLAMTSTGGEMLLRFVSNGSYTDFGWEANYTSSTSGGNNGGSAQYCNGTTNLTNSSGVFNDGSGSDNYDINSDCKWLISPSNATDITISFSWVDLENNYDFVKVYDGNSVNSPLLATYSGIQSSTLPVSSTGGEMLVHFTSDNLFNKDGFEATWTSYQNNSNGSGSSACSGQTTLNATSGTFSDGSGAQNYNPSSDCKWLIDVNGASSISLDFVSFDLENNYDFVTVYDGSTTNASVLATLTGNAIPSKVSSTGSQMLVHFTSDNVVNKLGWDAVYTAVMPTNGGGNGGFCSGSLTLTTPSGTFSDGSGSSDYASNSDCKWLISPANAFSITLTFNQLDIENAYDYVKVYDGNTVNAPLLGSYSGNTLPSNVTSSGAEMLVHFTSDNIVNKPGFDVTYSSTTTPIGAIDNEGYCTELTTFSLPAGSFHDGSGMGIDYLPKTHCFWLIQPSQADSIELTFISYTTEFNYDFIRVYDGTTVNSPLIDVISGTGIYKKVVSGSGAMLVEFQSDELYNDAGFLAIYSTKTIQNGGATTSPVADFMASAVNVKVGEAVNFFDISQNNPNSWNWIFVNGSAPTSSKKNPTSISYNAPGCYEVHLTASNNLGSDQSTKKCYINVSAMVGLGEGEAWVEKDIKIYPNPNDGKFSLYFNPEDDKETIVTITNILGEIIYETIVSGVTEFDEEIDLRNAGKGIYFINVHTGDDKISRRLVVD